jgi:hypothetical protein
VGAAPASCCQEGDDLPDALAPSLCPPGSRYALVRAQKLSPAARLGGAGGSAGRLHGQVKKRIHVISIRSVWTSATTPLHPTAVAAHPRAR